MVVSAASAGLFALAAALVVGVNAGARAQTAELQFVPSNSVPRSGTFYSIQQSNLPPLPCNLYPELNVYSLSDERAVLGGRSVGGLRRDAAAKPGFPVWPAGPPGGWGTNGIGGVGGYIGRRPQCHSCPSHPEAPAGHTGNPGFAARIAA